MPLLGVGFELNNSSDVPSSCLRLGAREWTEPFSLTAPFSLSVGAAPYRDI